MSCPGLPEKGKEGQWMDRSRCGLYRLKFVCNVKFYRLTSSYDCDIQSSKTWGIQFTCYVTLQRNWKLFYQALTTSVPVHLISYLTGVAICGNMKVNLQPNPTKFCAYATFCWHALLQKSYKMLCNRASPRHSGGNAFLHPPLAISMPTGAGKSSAGVGEGREGGWTRWQREEWGDGS